MFIKWLVLQSDPSSNRLAISAIIPRGCDLFNIWNGSKWVATKESLSFRTSTLYQHRLRSKASQVMFWLCFESSTSAVFYRPLKWQHNLVQQDGGRKSASNSEKDCFVSNHDLESNQILLLVKNKDDALFALPWDGSQFGDSTELDSNTGLNGNMPFTFVWNYN
mmetsp:Transcript_3660/g.6740  ORF Transcript_3660/g.6740 Transcript_3660/m.6740 type:complete len:164 (+) Transcript_3660:1360-1851(+)